ncbi:MAG: ABC transporter ATP-binding protein [Bacteroidales bacterium]|nr:ABC transporter ATP-binding protein [Bacteroidales bacterium]
MSGKQNPIISVHDLSISFISDGREYVAIKDVNFCVGQGEIVGIVGESGSGKSVTALSLMRLINCPPGKIKKGSILFYENEHTPVDLLMLSENEMLKMRGRRMSMIFQEPMTSLNPVYKCGTQVSEVLKLHTKISTKAANEKVIQLFKEVLLPRPEEIFNAYPHQISGGQKQRVMIAMALACNPSLLIADEPTTALDVTVQKTILELIKNIRDKFNLSIIFITHDLGVIAELADRVIVMYKGEIIEENSVDNIFSNPKHPYTKGLIACRPDMKKRLRQLPTVSDFLNASENSETKLNQILKQTITPEERKLNHSILYDSEPILRIENLSKSYPLGKRLFSFKHQNFKALNDISFEVYQGETLGLVGESGCGKTTLGRSILRLIEPSSGRIFYRHQDLSLLGSKALRSLRKDIQIIFQDPYSSLNPKLTIGDAITEPMKVHGIGINTHDRKNKAIALLEKVGMNASQLNRYPHEFSGGQRQRIVIARTLALNPKFIICDEPVSALDVSVQAQVLNLLNDLKKEFGFTYIFISHDLSVVKFLADRIIIMKSGKIVEINEADALYANPENSYTRKLISSIPQCINQ